jgi:hypothetical protein
MAEDTMNSARDSTTSKTPEINWQDFNYPPLLKIIHFTPSELPEEHKSIIWMLFATHIIILVESLLNIINNSVQTAEGFRRHQDSVLVSVPVSVQPFGILYILSR